MRACLTHQSGGGQHADVVAVGFIRDAAVGGILSILGNMVNKRREIMISPSLLKGGNLAAELVVDCKKIALFTLVSIFAMS